MRGMASVTGNHLCTASNLLKRMPIKNSTIGFIHGCGEAIGEKPRAFDPPTFLRADTMSRFSPTINTGNSSPRIFRLDRNSSANCSRRSARWRSNACSAAPASVRGLMFGLVFDGAIFLKVDASSIPDFEREGSRPFVYTRAKSKAASVALRCPIGACPTALRRSRCRLRCGRIARSPSRSDHLCSLSVALLSLPICMFLLPTRDLLIGRDGERAMLGPTAADVTLAYRVLRSHGR